MLLVHTWNFVKSGVVYKNCIFDVSNQTACFSKRPCAFLVVLRNEASQFAIQYFAHDVKYSDVTLFYVN